MAERTIEPGPRDAGADWQAERHEWIEALEDVLRARGVEAGQDLVGALRERLSLRGVIDTESALNTPYRNSIHWRQQPPYPGDVEIEQRIEHIVRWNAAAMVLQAYDSGTGVGGHIATYLSAATMMEVGFNHFFRAPGPDSTGDLLNFQAHAAPGVYARAFLEGRLTEAQLANFRRELQPGGGLPSYPHPRRMPDFWQMPTASMGLSTPAAIYQARFAKYLEHRGLTSRRPGRVWLYIGDGEADEPEVLGTINIASRERLDNLVMVVNCNLQRLDGPVRGNGKIIQELERSFRGADWHVIKVIWGSGWDPLFERDTDGLLQKRMDEAVDGDYQMYTVSPGDVVREHWVEKTPALRELMASLTDEEIRSIKRGGQDHHKVYAAYQQALQIRGKPVVILCKTVKGDGLGPGAEGANTAHQKKNLSAEERVNLARRFGIPLAEGDAARAAFYRPPEDSEEMRYLRARREALGGSVPRRVVSCPVVRAPEREALGEFLGGSGQRQVSTTMVLVRMLSKLLRDQELGRYVVPIVPDEARTFGMDGLFNQAGIYAPEGQVYRPVDADSIAPYREASDGQILQEGICETGAMASFLAAGTAYANHGLPMIPFYIFYSMFGFQRVGDMIWACGDNLARGFLFGGTSGRTTLNGEGLQHQDGHSLVLADTVPNLATYDPAFGFELALIVREGIRRMVEDAEDVFYYITVHNQAQPMPAQPPDPDDADGRGTVEQGVLAGLYRFEADPDAAPDARRVHLFGSGAIMQEVLDARDRLRALGLAVDVWSVTSHAALGRDLRRYERERLLGADAAEPWIVRQLGGTSGVYVVASDHICAHAEPLGRAAPGPAAVLGTDGFGLSEARPDLRDHFEVSGAWIAFAALRLLARDDGDAPDAFALAREWGLDPERHRERNRFVA